MRLFLLCAVLTINGIFGQDPCGCPYTPSSTCAGCDPAKLTVISTGSGTCTMSCERGWMMASGADYVECADGHSFQGSLRDQGAYQAMGDNPQLSCVKAPTPPKTCPAGSVKPFECTDCDASKIVVTPGTKAECTILCDRYYRLVAHRVVNGAGYNYHAGSASLRNSFWSFYYLGAMQTSGGGPLDQMSFSCELIPGTILPTVPTPCSCAMEGVEGTYTTQCLGDVSVVSCLSGKINVSQSETPGDTVAFERATCMLDGSWYGTSCNGEVYQIARPTPFFNCPDVQLPTVAPTVPPPPPCACAFENVGAAFNMAPPSSTCTNGANQVLKCDDKIYVKSGSDIAEFDSVSCSSGKWYGTGCDGTLSAIDAVSVQVQCGEGAEPPLCPQLPSRGGLRFIGIENGLQRYTCPGQEIAKITIEDKSGTIHAKYFECNSTYYQVSSSNGASWTWYTNKITDFSCRDYGRINQACAVPFFTNAWIQDGVIRCVKGYYTTEIGVIYAANTQGTLYYTDLELSSVSCGISGWTIDGTTLLGVQLSSFRCSPSPSSTASCGALTLAPRNVQYYPMSDLYQCYNAIKEEMKIVTPSTTYYGSKLQCVSGSWQFTGSNTVTIPSGSSVTCSPFQMDVLPSAPSALIYVGQTPEGLSRWTCIDSTIELEMGNGDDTTRGTVHAAYIDCNNTISCVDLGAKHYYCSDPWDIGGTRKGNRYECKRGTFLNSVGWIDLSGKRQEFFAENSDTKSLFCNKDGWQIEGSSISGVRVSDINCWNTIPELSFTDCNSSDIQFENYKLKFDFFRRYYTCYDDEILGYTFNSVTPHAKGSKLFCDKDSAGVWKWHWAFMNGTLINNLNGLIPVGAKMSCFTYDELLSMG
ncbi:hypothetical protein PRIPAC_88512 [Pristionchus pacificus]|uniref:Uncharacterized protein n=1 Tax=Pristionchus pacificus TaxID=54126 RepID=A0A2A6B7Z9_PRIPA|nr:hypothetical protein PRIPAC_88512 [Pristionchus pacificus]|eukprot:PDM61991.1 hypothetical protein PRIPAC_51433 [Pristionchus pacificus]